MVRGRFDLREYLEQTRKHLLRYPLAGIPHADDKIRSLDPRCDRDATSFIRILAGVRQEVSENLFQPRRVAIDHHRLAGDGDGQLLLSLLDKSSNGPDRSGDDGSEANCLLAEVNLPFRDSGDVEQVLDQAAEGFDLVTD